MSNSAIAVAVPLPSAADRLVNQTSSKESQFHLATFVAENSDHSNAFGTYKRGERRDSIQRSVGSASLVWSKNSKLEVGKHDHFSIGFFVHDFKPRVSFMSDHDALRA